MREDLRLIVISSSHAMPKLEEFFDGVPIVDLYCIEEDEPADHSQYELVEVATTVDTYLDDLVSMLCDIHCDPSIKGHFLVFLPSSKVGTYVLCFNVP